MTDNAKPAETDTTLPPLPGEAGDAGATTEAPPTALHHLKEEFAEWFEAAERDAGEILAWIESKL